jgi:hypothetical protein
MSSRPPAWDSEDAVIEWVGDLFAAAWAANTHLVLFARDLAPGKTKRSESGRPKMTEGARRASYPVHNAADEVIVIERLLRENYPDQKTGIRERAVEVVSRRHNIGAKKLRNYLRRSRRDRSRISA